MINSLTVTTYIVWHIIYVKCETDVSHFSYPVMETPTAHLTPRCKLEPAFSGKLRRFYDVNKDFTPNYLVQTLINNSFIQLFRVFSKEYLCDDQYVFAVYE